MTAGQNLRVAAYRFRPTLRRRLGAYVTLAVLVGLVGGVAIASFAAARRTQSSYGVYLASTNPSDLSVITGVLNPAIGNGAGYNAGLVRTISRLPHVVAFDTEEGIDVLPLSPTGSPRNDSYLPASAGNGLGSIDRGYFDQDRLSVLQGRMFDPRRADEVVMLARALPMRSGSASATGSRSASTPTRRHSSPGSARPVCRLTVGSTRVWWASSRRARRSSPMTSTPASRSSPI